MKYNVNFVQCWNYTVEAESEDEAEMLAYKEFLADMLSPFGHTFYDDCQIKCLSKNE